MQQEESRKESKRGHYLKFVVDFHVPGKSTNTISSRNLHNKSFCRFKQWHSFAWRLFFCTIRQRFSSCCHMSNFPVLLDTINELTLNASSSLCVSKLLNIFNHMTRFKGFRREPLVAASFSVNHFSASPKTPMAS